MTTAQYMKAKETFAAEINEYIQKVGAYSEEKTDYPVGGIPKPKDERMTNQEAAILFDKPELAKLPNYITPFYY